MPDYPLNKPPIIEEPIGDEELDDPDAPNLEDVDPEPEPADGSPADGHVPPLDDPADSKFLRKDDPRRHEARRVRPEDRRWH